jgi:hypothetical protein
LESILSYNDLLPKKETCMADVLMITAIAGAENCAGVLSKQFQMGVEIAASRKEALAAMRRREYLLMIVDESMIEPDEDGADALLRHAGSAILLEINFAISGYGRLVRAVRAALSRRERERELASHAAASAIQRDLREAVAGLLLHSQLTLAEAEVPPRLAEKLRVIVDLAVDLRQRLGGSADQAAAVESSSPGKTASVVPVSQRVPGQEIASRPPAANVPRRKPDDRAFLAMRHRVRPGIGELVGDR